MYIKVTDLPKSVQSALFHVGYRKPDIEVNGAESYSLNPSTVFEGSRGFVCAVNLDTGDFKAINGSWGGANPFEKTIDSDNAIYPMEKNMAIIKGESGGHGTFARVSVSPDNLARLLPAKKPTLTDSQGIVLKCFMRYKSFARKENAARVGISSSTYEATLKELQALGYIMIMSNGASKITTEGKNAASNFVVPKGIFL